MAERIAIVGIGQTIHKSKRPDVTTAELCAEAVEAALADAQLTMKDIDSVITGSFEVADGYHNPDKWIIPEIGAVGKSGFEVQNVGTTGGVVAATGFNLAATGLFDTVLCLAWQKMDEAAGAFGRGGGGANEYWTGQFPMSPITNFARRAYAYMDRSGCTEEHFAMVRVKQDQCAMKNPYAQLRLGLTVEKVMEDVLLAWPIRRLHMCPTTAGAAAFIVCPEAKAKKVTSKPVWVEDWFTCHQGGALTMAEDPTASTLRYACDVVYKRCGITNPLKEIQAWEVYEPASPAELRWIEEVGLCEDFTAWKLFEQGKVGIDKEIPFNPSGGVTATNPIGATPVVRLVEAALQIRGDGGERQVPGTINRALATAYGGQGENVIMLLRKSL
ncbi:MAG: acetyl-CoA acetyltransferase [Dehalococcoidia bacterium]|nr:MAG: acetyl-CoA acetyltransferase [Dehalococcoidia bacterium]